MNMREFRLLCGLRKSRQRDVSTKNIVKVIFPSEFNSTLQKTGKKRNKRKDVSLRDT